MISTQLSRECSQSRFLPGAQAIPGRGHAACHAALHAGGMQVLTLAAYLGLTLVIHADFDSRMCRDLVENRIAIALFAPTMISFLLNEIGDVAERDWSALKTIMYGASPIDKPLLLRAMEVFGCDFYQSYGLTETTATVTMLDASAHARGLPQGFRTSVGFADFRSLERNCVLRIGTASPFRPECQERSEFAVLRSCRLLENAR